MMNESRRKALKRGGLSGALFAGLAGGLLKPQELLAAVWNAPAFEAKTVADALKSLHISDVADSKDVVLNAPDIAENGAVVPIEITSKIPGTQSITVLVDKNPFPYIGTFDVSKGALPFVHVRVKMGETSNLRVIVAAGGKYYQSVKEVKITIGGCGG
jgi:sulfur-oxidizing protein SoxY